VEDLEAEEGRPEGGSGLMAATTFPLTHRSPDEQRQRENRAAGHTLCSRCKGSGNELFSMYRACEECGGSGIAVHFGELSPFGQWRAERQEERERKRLARKYRGPRDWKLEVQWRLSRWFGIGQCFHGSKDVCRRCEAWASDVDYEVRRVAPFRVECTDRQMCDEAIREGTDAQ
jgi:hypothetical protein